MLDDIRYLTVNLPEEILRWEMCGDYNKALEIIERRLREELPQAVRKRLELERELIPVLLEEYSYSYSGALELLQEGIRDFTAEEFDRYIDEGLFDWIYVDGEKHFISTFFENVGKIRHELTGRFTTPENPAEFEKRQALLNGNMAFMKKNGGNAYRFRIRTEMRVREDTARLGEEITVHLPIPTQGTQIRNIKILHTEPESCWIAPPEHGSRTVCFQVSLEKDQRFAVEYSFENHVTYTSPDPTAACECQPDFDTGELTPHIVFTPFIRSLYHEIVGDEKNPVIKARLIYNYITHKVRYSYVRKYITILNIPEYAGINGKGDCGVQALLFITLCRYGGIPARWQSGLSVTPDSIGPHDWAQFHIAPYGWLFADLSFGGGALRMGNHERQEFYFGNLDPFRMPANSEFQHEFDPPRRFTRCDPADNQNGEAEYRDRGLRRSEYKTTHTVLDAEQIPWKV